MKKTQLDKLYFGIVLYPLSYWSKEKKEKLTTYNLFDFGRVKWSVASYASKTEEEKREVADPLMYCFGSVWSRCEFEYVICPWSGINNNDKAVEVGTKVDVYKMYVEPNAEYLMSLVGSVSQSSAKAYLSAERKRRRCL